MPPLVRDVAALARERFDVLVLGGGINGTGVARDAARRGLSVALVEKEDFGYGTTGRSTRLIHGGLRYLAMYDFGLVRESLRERERLLRNAPHLVHPLTFLIPFYAGQRTPPWKIKIGLRLYDLLKGRSIIPPHRALSKREMLEAEPGLRAEDLRGGAMYGDGQIDLVERLCVENVIDAAEHGAVVANHCLVESVERDDHGALVRARDTLTGESYEVRARRIVNTTGPWLPLVPGLAHVKSRMTKGAHFVSPRSTEHAILLFSPDDDRVFFSIPWLGHELVGTTDTDYVEKPDDVHASEEDVEYLRRGIEFVLPRADVQKIHYAYAGIRNLVPEEGRSESDVSRKHQVIRHGGFPEMISLVGGKITPFRAVCEELVNLVAPDAPRSDTGEAALPGAPDDVAALEARLAARVAAARDLSHVPGTWPRALATTYGARSDEVLAICERGESMRALLCSHAPLVAAEVAHAVEREMARTAADVLLRRCRAGWMECEGRDALSGVLDALDRTLGRDASARKRDEEAYLRAIAVRHTHER